MSTLGCIRTTGVYITATLPTDRDELTATEAREYAARLIAAADLADAAAWGHSVAASRLTVAGHPAETPSTATVVITSPGMSAAMSTDEAHTLIDDIQDAIRSAHGFTL